jgi:tape measure domain-containing protein
MATKKRVIEEIVLKVSTDMDNLNKLNKGLFKTEKRMKKATSGALKFAAVFVGAFASIGAALKASGVSKEFDKIEGSLNTLFGSADAAKKELGFLTGISDELGLVTIDIANGYSKLVASMDGANISAEKQRDIFKAVATTGTALGKSTDEINGILTAFGQIAAKGRVQSEELLQIAERNIPINALLAEALGVTTMEMKEQVATGNVLASDILPKLAKVMQDRYAKGALKNAQKDTARFNRLTNTLNESLRKMGILVNEVVLGLGEGMIDSAERAFNSLLDTILNISQQILPGLLVAGKAVFDGLDTLVFAFSKTFFDAISFISDGWELLFQQVTGEENFITTITDMIAIAAKTWPQMLTTPFLAAFQIIIKGLQKLQDAFFNITDAIEEAFLGQALINAETFGSPQDVLEAEDAIAQQDKEIRERSSEGILSEIDDALSSLIQDAASDIQDAADEVVLDRIKREEEINILMMKIRNRFKNLLKGFGGGKDGQGTTGGVASIVSRQAKEGLEVGSKEAAKFLTQGKISSIQDKQLTEQKKTNKLLEEQIKEKKPMIFGGSV